MCYIIRFLCSKTVKIYICIEAHKINIDDIIFENGLPTAYILMKIERNTPYAQIKNSLDSIAKQNYKNIKVVIFIFGEHKSSGMSEHALNILIKSYFRNQFMQFILFRRESFNKSSAALEIRKIFCDTANEDDIAIFLDPNDELDNKKTVSEIVKKFAITDANMCLLNFTETENIEHSLIRHDKTIHNNILKYIEEKKGLKKFSNELQLHATMTLNCVKAFKKKILYPFVESIEKFDNDMRGSEVNFYYFSTTGNYSSFVDFLAFLVKDVKLTAISKNTHKYVQYKDKHKVYNFKEFLDDRINALKYTLEFACHSKKNLVNNSTINFFMYFIFKLYVITLLIESLNFEENKKEEFPNYSDISKDKNVEIFIKEINNMLYKFMNEEDIYGCELYDSLKDNKILNNNSSYKNLINTSLLQKCFDDAQKNSKNNIHYNGLFRALLEHFKKYKKYISNY